MQRRLMSLVLSSMLIALSHSSWAELRLFLATLDASAYAQHPSRYERIVLPPDSSKDVVYVERSPTLRIALDEIDGVRIESRRTYTDTQGALDDTARFGEGGDPRKNGSRTYIAMFRLSDKAWQKFAAVLQAHGGQLADVRLGNSRLGIGRLTALADLRRAGPQSGRLVETALEERNRTRVEQIFAPLRAKVTWR